jgi:hypothetical protein
MFGLPIDQDGLRTLLKIVGLKFGEKKLTTLEEVETLH